MNESNEKKSANSKQGVNSEAASNARRGPMPKGRRSASKPDPESNDPVDAADAEKRLRKEAKQQKKLIKSLRLSDAKARKLLQVIDTGLAFHDLVRDDEGLPVDYRIREVNSTFENLLQLSAAKVIGGMASKVYATRGRAPFLKDIVLAMESKEPRVVEGVLKTVKARLRCTIQPVDDSLFALLFEDATEDAKARRRRAFLETRLKSVSTEHKRTLESLTDARAEARDLKKRMRILEKERDQGASAAAKATAALETKTVKLAHETAKREALQAALSNVAEIRDGLRVVAAKLTKALKTG